MDHESDLFKTYFHIIEIMEGGADTGFRHVKPTEYKPRLLHFHGDKKRVTVKEVQLSRKSLDSSDVYILDLGLEIFQWNGKTCNKDEKFKAVQYLQTLKSERGGKPKVESLDERDISPTHRFYGPLPNVDIEQDEQEDDSDFQPTLLRVSDEGGSLETSVVSEGNLDRGNLDPKDVFIADTGKEVFVWIGSGASPAENKNALPYAHNYLMRTKHPLVPVTCIKDGKETSAFKAIFN
jgi:gelsolin